MELGLSDSDVGSILGISNEMVRHYGKRARALTIAKRAAETVTGGMVPLAGRLSALPPKSQAFQGW